jgi:hypothetical protein
MRRAYHDGHSDSPWYAFAMRLGRRVLAAATLFVAACGYPSFDFLPPDDGGALDSSITETGDETGDASHDAADTSIVDALDGAKPDTAIDSGIDTRDVGPGVDVVPLDLGTDTTDAHVDGCKDYPAATFCDDWDTSTGADSHWSAEYVVNGGALLMDAGDASPNCFLSRFVAESSGSEEAAVLNEPVTAPLTYATVQVDVDIKLAVDHYDAGAVLVKVGRPGTGRGFDLSLGPMGFYVEVLGTTSTSKELTGTTVPIGRWFHVRMKGQVMMTGATVTIWIDDPTFSSPAYNASALSTATEDDVKQQLDLGLYSDVSPFTAYDAEYDTVALQYP